jgi:hypothetical protein
MPQAITETDDFPASLSRPLPGEGASASTLMSLFIQGATNRTRWLYNELRSRGAQFIRRGTVAEMQALSGAATGSIFLVFSDTSPTLQGIYAKTTQTVAAGEPWVYAASGGGYWVSATYSLLAANGLAKLNSLGVFPWSYLEAYLAGPDSNASLGAGLTLVRVPTLSADRTWTVANPTENGARMSISAVGSTTGTYKVTVQTAGLLPLAYVSNNTSVSDYMRSVELRAVGGAWIVWSYSKG